MSMQRCFFSCALFLFFLIPIAHAEIALRDAEGRTFLLQQPAQRMVALAPHLTDMLLTLGARSRIVGVSDDHENRGAYSKSLSGLPVVSDAASINYEKLLALKPDLVLAWGSGTPRAWTERIRQLGIPVFVVEARRLSDMAVQLKQLGILSGNEQSAQQQAQIFTRQTQSLQQRYGDGRRFKYFYQIWAQPLYSLHAGHLLSQALALCGADNIVPVGAVIAPLINPEFVLQQNPEVIIFGAADAVRSRAYWNRFSGLQAVRKKQMLAVDDKRLTRPGPDFLVAVAPVCEQLALWRTMANARSR